MFQRICALTRFATQPQTPPMSGVQGFQRTMRSDPHCNAAFARLSRKESPSFRELSALTRVATASQITDVQDAQTFYVQSFYASHFTAGNLSGLRNLYRTRLTPLPFVLSPPLFWWSVFRPPSCLLKNYPASSGIDLTRLLSHWTHGRQCGRKQGT